MKDVFSYTDFRTYIQEMIRARKAEDPTFTHRRLCDQLGLHTSNFVLMITRGRRNLPAGFAQKLANGFGLEGPAADYFLWMVLYGQATTTKEKDHYWNQMLACRAQSQTSLIQEPQHEYYKHWYNAVIRELVAVPHRQWWDAEHISQVLKPKISSEEAQQSLELLEQLGFIHPEGRGWVKTSNSVATLPEVKSSTVHQYHREQIDLAKNSLEEDSSKIRNFSTVTMEMNAQEYALVVKMLTDFRRETLGVCGSRGPADRVCQLNLQFFPVSSPLSTLPEHPQE